jgi:HAD superfamily hydrolase (TIGR01509 family)
MTVIADHHFSKIKPSGILWDMDGVLVDSADCHYTSWVNALRPYGVEYTRSLFNSTFGMNNQSIIESIFGNGFPVEDFLKISNGKEAAYREAVHGQVTLLPGVQLWLDRFADQGIPQALASSAPMENIDAILDETGIRKYFKAVVAAYGKAGKPDPWVFVEAGKRLGADPHTGIVIEDSPAGVLGAFRAGYRCIAVSTILTAEESKTANLVVDRLDRVSFEDIEFLLSD